MADTGDIGGRLIRYLYPTEDECIVIQELVPGGRGKVSAEMKICSVDGRDIDDYASVDFKEGISKDGKLLFEVDTILRQPVVERLMTCEIFFNGGLADVLFCKDK